MKPTKFILLLWSFGTIATSCHHKPKDPFIGKQIHLDKELKLIFNQLVIQDIPDSLQKGKYRIITIHDATCPKCIYGKLNLVDQELFSRLHGIDKMDVIHILNIQPGDSLYFRNKMYAQVKVQGELIWDRNFIFEESNELFTPDESKRVFLVDPQQQDLNDWRSITRS
ncbi:hypothetical protein OAT16_02285 [Prolixibacteraceae bacterium]|nr:hypothetical protein [Prolixibacteraceae bacterium]